MPRTNLLLCHLCREAERDSCVKQYARLPVCAMLIGHLIVGRLRVRRTLRSDRASHCRAGTRICCWKAHGKPMITKPRRWTPSSCLVPSLADRVHDLRQKTAFLCVWHDSLHLASTSFFTQWLQHTKLTAHHMLTEKDGGCLLPVYNGARLHRIQQLLALQQCVEAPSEQRHRRDMPRLADTVAQRRASLAPEHHSDLIKAPRQPCGILRRRTQ